MKARISLLLGGSLLMAILVGCSVNTELGGARIPNSAPDTRITGSPPTLLEAGFAVSFNWTGSDPDGKIAGFQWKISNNGNDGITPSDTLTVDPLTGAEIHPWRFTVATDTTFLVLADQPDFPGDEHNRPRSFRTHTLFVRALDDNGAVDPSPDHISFTSTTLVPTARAVYPDLSSGSVKTVPPTVNMSWSGEDPDYELRTPTQVRFLWKPAIDMNGNFIRTRDNYDQHYSEILNFDDPDWSPWLRYSNESANRRVSFPQQTDGSYYLFAVQTADTAGAVSVGLGYQVEVAHVWIRSGFYSPSITVLEPFLGLTSFQENESQIASGQPLNFRWAASAAHYNGTITSYRHGWNLIDPDNPADPGWAVPPGLAEQNLFAAEQSFLDGVQSFHLRVTDDSGQSKDLIWNLRVVPFVQRESQRELLVLDQTIDDNVQNWLDASGRSRNRENFRNPYWQFLGGGAGGVADVIWERDWRDHTDAVDFDEVVNYKVVLCYATANSAQTMFSQFRPTGSRDQFVWMTPYQRRGGNLFLVGASSMDSFLEILPSAARPISYMLPVVFDTRETTFVSSGTSYQVGFPPRTEPDGTIVQRGTLQYPYATAGVSVLDWTSPAGKTIYARNQAARFDRHVDCVGLKGLALVPEFKDFHLIGPGVMPDTMFTDPEIDWHDPTDTQTGDLGLFNRSFPFRDDEFIDANISGTRATTFAPQACDGEDYPAGIPDGLCVQPMFTGIARFDWLREYRWSQGETDWPSNRYTDSQLIVDCGAFALTSYQGRPRSSAKTNGQTFGYFSYKMIADKQVQRADVFWGFDPYRFDPVGSKKAIRWVLEYFGLSINPTTTP